MSGRPEIVVVGGSWGGMDALIELLRGLSPEFDVPVVVVLHRAASSTDGVLERHVASKTSLRVVEADDKVAIERGTIYVAPADYHLMVEPGSLALSVDAPVRLSRPSIDVTFESAADSYGAGVVAVVLTGANDDGAIGVSAVRRAGGTVLVQEPASAERREMPDAAVATGAVDRVLPLRAIAAYLSSMTGADA